MGEIRGPWTINSERIGYENPWMCVTEYDVTRPDGKPGLYGVVTPKHLALAILPIDTHGYVTLVEGGGHLDGDPQACAARELREETGLLASDWREIMRLDLSNCITDERAIGYLATGLTEGEADPDDTEVLETRRLHFRDALAELHAGEIEDALTVAMLLRAYYMASEGHFDAALTAAMLDV